MKEVIKKMILQIGVDLLFIFALSFFIKEALDLFVDSVSYWDAFDVSIAIILLKYTWK